jgi:hypothetical protein
MWCLNIQDSKQWAIIFITEFDVEIYKGFSNRIAISISVFLNSIKLKWKKINLQVIFHEDI